MNKRILIFLTTVALSACNLSILAQTRPTYTEPAPQYTPQPAYAQPPADTSNTVEVLLVIFLVLIFIVAIGLFAGFVIIMKKNERTRVEERESIIFQAQETIKSMSESIAEQNAKMEAQKKEFERRLTEQSSMEQDMIDDVTQRVLIEKRTTMSLTYINGERVNHTEIIEAHDRKGAARRYKVGRSQKSGCDLVIPGDHSVAREQAIISFTGASPDEKYYILDLGGANPTSIMRGSEKIAVNGKTDLQDGDILALGRTHLRVALYQASSELSDLQA